MDADRHWSPSWRRMPPSTPSCAGTTQGIRPAGRRHESEGGGEPSATRSRVIWLDVARLLERACIGSLTGIDRVELAYAERLPAHRIRFVVLNRWSSRFSLLPERAVRAFLAALRAAWESGHTDACRSQAMRLLARAAVARAPVERDAVYLLVSHRHLHRAAALEAALRRTGATFVPLIHDIIPLEYPEYGRPGEAERHARRMAAVSRLADAVVVNSEATGEAVRDWLPGRQPVFAAGLGVETRGGTTPMHRPVLPSASPPGLARPGHATDPDASGHPDPIKDRPYFLCVGTIEPRKNHLLLLHLWRRLVSVHGDRAPRLLIAGRRGWENENIVDLLDRCSALRGYVAELGPVPDAELARLTRHARALLMPSFAEGFGLPVAEALASGTPVVCSDLPALREAGGDVAEYLDPLDAPAWQVAVMDYAADGSPRRAAQLGRMAGWRVTSWDTHVAAVLDFVSGVRARTPIGLAWSDYGANISTCSSRAFISAPSSTA